jgi:hypothetical protein
VCRKIILFQIKHLQKSRGGHAHLFYLRSAIATPKLEGSTSQTLKNVVPQLQFRHWNFFCNSQLQVRNFRVTLLQFFTYFFYKFLPEIITPLKIILQIFSDMTISAKKF